MPKIDVDYRDYFRPLAAGLQGKGLLLVSVDAAGRPNAMTIGWATLGPIWRRPLFVAMVRPSRYTFGLVEATGDYTVNLLPAELAPALDLCGHVSGRSHDKFAEAGLTATPGRRVRSPGVEQALLTLECRVVHRCDLAPEWLDPEIRRASYPRGDHHRFFFGEILAAYADPDLAKG